MQLTPSPRFILHVSPGTIMLRIFIDRLPNTGFFHVRDNDHEPALKFPIGAVAYRSANENVLFNGK